MAGPSPAPFRRLPAAGSVCWVRLRGHLCSLQGEGQGAGQEVPGGHRPCGRGGDKAAGRPPWVWRAAARPQRLFQTPEPRFTRLAGCWADSGWATGGSAGQLPGDVTLGPEAGTAADSPAGRVGTAADGRGLRFWGPPQRQRGFPGTTARGEPPTQRRRPGPEGCCTRPPHGVGGRGAPGTDVSGCQSRGTPGSFLRIEFPAFLGC